MILLTEFSLYSAASNDEEFLIGGGCELRGYYEGNIKGAHVRRQVVQWSGPPEISLRAMNA